MIFANKMKYLIILSVLFLPSCLPEVRRQTITPDPEMSLAPVIPADTVDKKITAIQGLMDREEISEKDMNIATRLVSDYMTIESIGKKPLSDTDYRNIIQILFKDLIELDEKYLLKGSSHNEVNYSDVMKEFSTIRKKIIESYLSSDFQGVVSGCVEMESLFGPESLTPEIGLIFAESLAKKGMKNEAIGIGERILRELDGKPDLIHLRAGIIKWQLELGHRQEAVKLYEKLVDNMDERQALFSNTKKMLEEPEKVAMSIHDTTGANEMIYGEGPIEPNQLTDLMKEVERLTKRHAFTEAKLLLVKMSLRMNGGPQTDVLDEALKSVEIAEQEYKEGLLHQKETMENAIKSIEKENYEEAISSLDTLQPTEETGTQLKKLKDLAVEKLIDRDRNKAARLFLMAKETSDPKKKEELLLSSYEILKNLVDKYPLSSLINKLNNHLERVNSELEKIRGLSG